MDIFPNWQADPWVLLKEPNWKQSNVPQSQSQVYTLQTDASVDIFKFGQNVSNVKVFKDNNENSKNVFQKIFPNQTKLELVWKQTLNKM